MDQFQTGGWITFRPAASEGQTGLRDAIGKTARELVPSLDESWFRLYGDVALTGTPARFENHAPAMNRWFDVYASRVGRPELRQVALVFKDVTLRRKAEEELEAALQSEKDARVRAEALADELKRRVASEQQLVGMVSHDLRNPLSAMLLGATTLLKRGELDERSMKSVRRIISSGERARRMVHDLLDFTQARLGAGIPVRPRLCDLHELASQVAEEFLQVHPDREVVVRHEGLAEGEWDPDRLSQAIGNLVANAFQYGDPRRPVHVTSFGGDSEVVVEVLNYGPAIPSESLPTLFQPLQRGENREHQLTRSIGLGLFIVEQIVQSHGGRVEVNSQDDQTVFRLLLPRAAVKVSAG